jgi:protein ImuA
MSGSPLDLETLRARVRRLERGARPVRPVRRLGVPAVDDALPSWEAEGNAGDGGLPLGCLHHVADGAPLARAAGGGAGGAALAFSAVLAERLARTDSARPRPVVWCLRAGGPDDTLYGPGLAPLGLTPGRLIVVRAPDGADVAWAMEEALRCPDVGAVVGQIPGRLDPAAGRRLTLAAEAGGGGAVLLRPARDPAESVPGAVTRWRVSPVPAAPTPWGQPGRPRWHVALEHCRNGCPHAWTMEWNHDTGDLDLAAELCDRPHDADPGRALRRAG